MPYYKHQTLHGGSQAAGNIILTIVIQLHFSCELKCGHPFHQKYCGEFMLKVELLPVRFCSFRKVEFYGHALFCIF